jgi:hypothetical protein
VGVVRFGVAEGDEQGGVGQGPQFLGHVTAGPQVVSSEGCKSSYQIRMIGSFMDYRPKVPASIKPL